MFGKDCVKNTVSVLWIIDTLIGIFCIAAAIDIAFAPGRLATFESGVLALVVIFLSLLIIVSALAPGFLIHKWLRALEKFIGKGIMYILLGILVSSPTVAWRLIPAGMTVAIGFAYIIFSVVQKGINPKPLISSGTEDPPHYGAPELGGVAANHSAVNRVVVRAPVQPVEQGPAPAKSQNPFLNPPPEGQYYPNP